MSEKLHTQTIKERVFTRWLNHIFAGESTIDDIETAFSDGYRLVLLYELLTGKTISSPHATNSLRKMECIEVVLKAFSAYGISATSYADDIYKGNTSQIINFLWCLILRFEINLAKSELSTRLALLRWISTKVHRDIRNFNSSWKDAQLLSILIEEIDPSLHPIGNGSSLFTSCFTLARENLNVPQLLSVDDVVPVIEETTLMLYLSYLHKASLVKATTSKHVSLPFVQYTRSRRIDRSEKAESETVELEKVSNDTSEEHTETGRRRKSNVFHIDMSKVDSYSSSNPASRSNTSSPKRQQYELSTSRSGLSETEVVEGTAKQCRSPRPAMADSSREKQHVINTKTPRTPIKVHGQYETQPIIRRYQSHKSIGLVPKKRESKVILVSTVVQPKTSRGSTTLTQKQIIQNRRKNRQFTTVEPPTEPVLKYQNVTRETMTRNLPYGQIMTRISNGIVRDSYVDSDSSSEELTTKKRFKIIDPNELLTFQKHKYETLYTQPIGLFKYTLCDCEVDDKHTFYFEAQRRAKKSSEAMWICGSCCYLGAGVQQNMNEALKWFNKAAKKGDERAQNMTGIMHALGYGCSRNLKYATEIFSKCKTLVEAHFNECYCLIELRQPIVFEKLKKLQDAKVGIALCHMYGLGVRINTLKAYEHFKEAHENGDALAEMNCGICLMMGIGCNQSMPEAIEYFKRASRLGCSAAHFQLGMLYHFGVGIEQSNLKAVECYERGVNSFDPKALCNMGICHEKGDLCLCDFVRSIRMFEICSNWSVLGKYHLAICHLNGLGCKKNVSKAVNLLREASKQGDPNAQFSYALCFFKWSWKIQKS
ncbi:hypothetical protein QTN25_003049 [Entamoeba marina]